MLDDMLFVAAIGVIVLPIAKLYLTVGEIKQKVDFMYKHIKVYVDWENHNNK